MSRALRIVLAAALAGHCAGCPTQVPALDSGSPDLGPDAGPDLHRLPPDTMPPSDLRVYDPDYDPGHDLGCMTRMVSITSQGWQLNAPSYMAGGISRDGRVVLFASRGAGPKQPVNKYYQLYAHDLVTGKTELVSQSTAGASANADIHASSWAVSGDGRYVVFSTKATNLTAKAGAIKEIYLRDRQAGTTTLVSLDLKGQPSGVYSTGQASISNDGRYIAFISSADDLVAGDTNNKHDIFVRDLKLGKTERATLADDGSQLSEIPKGSYQISGDGRYVVFTNQLWLVAGSPPGGKHNRGKVYIRDLVAKRTELLSYDEQGKVMDSAYDPSVSRDGTSVVFQALDDNFYLAERSGGKVKVRRVSSTQSGKPLPLETAAPAYPRISPDGLFVTFTSHTADLVPGDSGKSQDIFRVDLTTGATTRVTVGVNGQAGSPTHYGQPYWSSALADGGKVVFNTSYDNLIVKQDRPGSDVFVRPGCP